MTLELTVDGTNMTAMVRNQEQRVSPHTGRLLAVLEVQARLVTDDATRRALGRSLQERTSVVESADGRRFKVATSSYSYTGDSPVTTFTLGLEEVEDVLATSVLIGASLPLTPERYHEEHRDGAIIIEMLTTTTGDETTAMETAIAAQTDGAYFPVVRDGVRPETLEMRFGRCLWEKKDDGGQRHFVVLVERPYDEVPGAQSRFVGFSDPELGRAMEAIASLQEIVDALVQTTVAGGLMPAADAIGVRTKAAPRV